MKWNNEKKDLTKEQSHPKETQGMHSRLKQNFKNLMNSVHNKMSRGSEYLSRIWSNPKKDQAYHHQENRNHHKPGGSHNKKD